MGEQVVDEGKRYKIVIDGVNYYVLLTDISVSVHYAYENREENIKTRTVLEKFCAGLSKIMEENNVQKTLGNVAVPGSSKRIESKDGATQEVCG